jgi:hypothetical protein
VEPTNPSLDLEHSEATEAENSPVVEISKQETPSVEETPSVLEEKMIQELIAKEKKLKEKEEREKAEKIIIEAGFRPLLENLPEDDKKRLVYKVIL